MIDLKLLQSIIRKNATLLSLDAEFSLIGELQSQEWANDKNIKTNDARLTGFDAFGFAWNRQPRDSKLRILAAAYRTHRSLFDASDLLNRIDWEQFDMAQQVVIKNTSLELLSTVAALFANECAAADFLSGFVIAAEDAEQKQSEAMYEKVRAA